MAEVPKSGFGEESTAGGIIQCLRMLMEEANALQLLGTRLALQRAIAVCEAEHFAAAVVGEAPIFASAVHH